MSNALGTYKTLEDSKAGKCLNLYSHSKRFRDTIKRSLDLILFFWFLIGAIHT